MLKIISAKSFSYNIIQHTSLQVQDLSWLNPASAAEIGKVFMSSDTIRWRDVSHSWLSGRSHDLTDTLESLFDKYIPQVVDFIRPVLANSAKTTSSNDSTVSMSDKVSHCVIESQDLLLSEVHLMNTCCQILEVRVL